MPRIILVLTCALAGLLASPFPCHANGILLAGEGSTTAARSDHPVRLRRHTVNAKLDGQIAQVTVEQVFYSSSHQQLEGTYLFPLPEGAVVSDFAMTMAGKMVKGEVIEAKRARAIYEGIVRRKKDPGLLEYVGRGMFRARVFPIEPGKELTIRLSFQQVLTDDDGTLEFRYPLATDRMNG
ncbi:MAG: VIT domain-containing protein, partial [Planctomycetota bacterium]|nr:VIT domain-containing protein [Planctomycetota bacterium]